MKLIYSCPFGMVTGYARASHDNLMALRSVIDPQEDILSIEPMMEFDDTHRMLPSRYNKLLPYLASEGNEVDHPTHVLIHTIPLYAHEFVTGDMAPRPGVKKIVYTTWETDRFPHEAAERLAQHFDAMLVPCVQNRDVFRSAGFDKPIFVVPHCHDPAFWTNDNAIKKNKRFTFYWIGVWSERKNPIGLLKAYLTTFTADDDVELIVATGDYSQADFETLVRCMGLTNLPRMRFWTGAKTDDDILELHRHAHCYATVARGEGFGLGAHEAALLGNTVIAPDFAGLRAALDGHSDWIDIDFSLTPAITPEVVQGARTIQIAGLTIAPVTVKAPTGVTADQNWAEPNLGECKTAMRQIYDEWKVSPREWERRVSEPDFNNRFTYAKVGRDMYNILRGI